MKQNQMSRTQQVCRRTRCPCCHRMVGTFIGSGPSGINSRRYLKAHNFPPCDWSLREWQPHKPAPAPEQP